MPPDDVPAPAPTRVGSTPIGDAVAVDPASEATIKAAALLAAIEAAGLPVLASEGAVSIEIHAAADHVGKGVRMLVVAKRDGQVIAGWDPDRVHVNPPADFFADGTVIEDPLAVCTRDLLEYAAAA